MSEPAADRLTLLADEAVRRAFASALGTKRLGRTIEYRDVIATTMDRATELVRAGTADGTLIIANHQTAGRGRRGRAWGFGPPGSLLIATWLVRVAADFASLFTVLSAVPLLRASRALGARDLWLKWPNDLLLGDRKVAGILATNVADSAGERWISLGTGIDVHTREYPGEVGAGVTSFAASGFLVDRLALLARIAPELEALVDAGPEERRRFVAEWRENAVVLGREVRIDDGTRTFVAEAVDLDDDGALLVRRAGALERVIVGDVSLRPA